MKKNGNTRKTYTYTYTKLRTRAHRRNLSLLHSASLNPSIPQSFNPSIPQSFNPSIPQSLHLILSPSPSRSRSPSVCRSSYLCLPRVCTRALSLSSLSFFCLSISRSLVRLLVLARALLLSLSYVLSRTLSLARALSLSLYRYLSLARLLCFFCSHLLLFPSSSLAVTSPMLSAAAPRSPTLARRHKAGDAPPRCPAMNFTSVNTNASACIARTAIISAAHEALRTISFKNPLYTILNTYSRQNSSRQTKIRTLGEIVAPSA